MPVDNEEVAMRAVFQPHVEKVKMLNLVRCWSMNCSRHWTWNFLTCRRITQCMQLDRSIEVSSDGVRRANSSHCICSIDSVSRFPAVPQWVTIRNRNCNSLASSWIQIFFLFERFRRRKLGPFAVAVWIFLLRRYAVQIWPFETFVLLGRYRSVFSQLVSNKLDGGEFSTVAAHSQCRYIRHHIDGSVNMFDSVLILRHECCPPKDLHDFASPKKGSDIVGEQKNSRFRWSVSTLFFSQRSK